MDYYVYCLIRKDEHRPCYIGCTKDPALRKRQHTTQKTRCLETGDFTFVVLESINNKSEALRLEYELILWYSSRVPLLNDDGTPEGKAKKRAFNIARNTRKKEVS